MTFYAPLSALFQIPLRLPHRIHQNLHRLQRIFSRSGLARQHHRCRALLHRAEYIGHFRPRRHRPMLHGSEHLRDDHKRSPVLSALIRNLLLRTRKLCQGHRIPMSLS